jgi:hypothetical protein
MWTSGILDVYKITLDAGNIFNLGKIFPEYNDFGNPYLVGTSKNFVFRGLPRARIR